MKPTRERSLYGESRRDAQGLSCPLPKSLVLSQIECDMVARRGDFTRAIELTREMDQTSKTSPAGALLRARLYSMLGANARYGAGLYGIARPKPPPARRAASCWDRRSFASASPTKHSSRPGSCSTSTRNGSTRCCCRPRRSPSRARATPSAPSWSKRRSTSSRPSWRPIRNSLTLTTRLPRFISGARTKQPRRPCSRMF